MRLIRRVMRRLGRQGALVALVLLCAASATGTVHAAADDPSNGITISPAFQQITVSDTTPEQTYTFSVTNSTSNTYEFALSAVDFGSLDQSGGVLFMGQPSQELSYKYGLSKYVTLGQDRIVVAPKSTVKVPLTITNKQSLAPGGHYGAILLKPTDADGKTNKVQINQVLSSLLFVTKENGAIYKLSLHDYDVNTHLFTAPSSVNLRFQNSGNVHVVPRGVAIVTDPRGRIVKKGFINAGSAIILPETFRQLQIPLQTVASSWLPGRYHVTIQYRYDGSDSITTREASFIYINGWYVIGAAIVVAFVVLLLVSKRFRRAVSGFCRAIGRAFAWPFHRHRRTVS